MSSPVKIFFSEGTLLLDGDDALLRSLSPSVVYDERAGRHRAPASAYAEIILGLRDAGAAWEDRARDYSPLNLEVREPLAPRQYQTEAFLAWKDSGRRGVVVMPTGSGKTYFAVMAIKHVQRSSVVLVPTIDLMRQWADTLEKFFGVKVGMLGGGSRELAPLTVSTYDSASILMDKIGSKFGFIIFDECHHLPSPVNRLAAAMCIAPFRLGLTATPEREEPDADEIMETAVGPVVYQIHIDELEGRALAPYNVETLVLELDPDELEEYQKNRKVYTSFLKRCAVDFSDRRNGWLQFVGRCARDPEGRKAFEAYLTQKRIAMTGRSKTRKIWELLTRHKGERAIIFTAENASAYEIGRIFFLPVITHRTKVSERKSFLDKFRSGELPAIVTSKVLNEGIDVPEASVGIIVSGAASVREHVQRLGRILRAAEGKKAVLYELVSGGTAETGVNARRRQHRAYKRFASFQGDGRQY